MGRNRGSGV